MKTKGPGYQILLLLFLLTTQVVGQVPRLLGPVNDYADLLSVAEENALSAKLLAQEDSTSNQIVVLTISSLDGKEISDYSVEVGRSWALGQSDKDNGVLLLISLEDREAWIAVGYGLEGSLPDITASQIVRNEIIPEFRKESYADGINAGVDAITQAIAGEYESYDDESLPLWVWILIIMFVTIILILLLLSSFGTGYGYGYGGGRSYSSGSGYSGGGGSFGGGGGGGSW